MKLDHEVVIIGAGFSGIGAAIKLKQNGIDDFVILDGRDGIGGVWHVNTYPGVAVDITSFTYSFSFEPNPDWSRVFAPGAELARYAEHCADKYGLRPHLRMNTKVTAAEWDEEQHFWRIRLAGGRDLTTRFMITATGGLTQPKRPDIDGLADFTGAVVHTAEWDHALDLRGRRVAVIGTGASALQLIPAIADDTEQLTVYQRTPIWVFPKFDFALPAPVRRLFRAAPITQRSIRAVTTALSEVIMVAAISYQRDFPIVTRGIEAVCRRHLHRQVPDPALREKLQPGYGFGCKRPSFSNTYLKSFTRPDVDLETVGIERITPTGIRTRDGREQRFDVLVLATGFKVFEPGNLPSFPIIGRDGRDLGKFWETERFQAYEGTSVPKMPNLWMVLGPYSFTGNSWFAMIEYQTTHALRCITAARQRGATAVEVTQQANDEFFQQILRRQRHAVFFNSNCASANSYYFDAHGDAPFVRPSFTAEASWRARRFPMRHYTFREAV
ncbi:NAD(P)/FAD-dependent oxidoreductase [Nocardia sp. 2]|uniref:NAD(P)/FAD-dependent oxidoreductase n=1 Tax=Nocardia acididurans TaxID=2802282 RepID=A0ABS1MFR1_9NOCA|nr:NAD(P)/FAD-dependent oxidoreductase [Nocardia acididurans]MBL1079424.1 NAD(P)/FAD-dependent oxidoreductase [Nocardia acididurans]